MSHGSNLGGGLGSGNLGLGGGSGPLANLLGLGNNNFAQGLNYRTDPLSCTVFVSNVSIGRDRCQVQIESRSVL